MNHDPDDKIALLAERDALKAKLDASERAASAMRQCLRHFRDERRAADLGVPDEVLNALSTDAGRDYVHRSEVEAARRKGMTDAAELLPEELYGVARYKILAARDAKKESTL